jgi:hypothetical protein
MAGLSHDPSASNCVKNESGLAVEGAVCRLCERRQATEPAAEAAPTPPNLIGQFLERCGIVKGGLVYDVRTTDGEILGGAWTVTDVAGLSDRDTSTLEIVITIAEEGVRGAMPRRVRWSQIVSFHA